ncbi:hypothetical protein V144x_31410 [Gimesia aquarii]|uniref:Uncharacterized protein n=1 Tax=Gimesia aquarii TaxID=2527964 RepID=A0A517VXD4_9PLAN|nr:hypothetical protein V144x_31410 [Gimesia aquarii]
MVALLATIPIKSPAVVPPLFASKVIPPSTVDKLLPSLSTRLRLAVREIAPDVDVTLLSTVIVCAVTFRSFTPMTVLFVWKLTSSSVSPVIVRSDAFRPSKPSTLTTSAPEPLPVKIVRELVAVAKLTDSPRVESMSKIPSLVVASSESVMVSSAPAKSNTRLAAIRSSVIGSNPV